MKPFYYTLLLAVLIPCVLRGEPVRKNSVGTEDITVITLKLGGYDKDQRWEDKVPGIAEMVKQETPAVIGIQNCSTGKVEDLDMRLDGYDSFGDSTDDGEGKGRTNAIYYRKDCLKLIKSGTFWFSDTPDTPGTQFDGASQFTNATWGIFSIKGSGRKFFFLTTDLDVSAEKILPTQAKLILTKMEELAHGIPSIVCGDFRSTQAGMSKIKEGNTNPCLVMVDKMIDGRRVALCGDEEKTINHFGKSRGKVKDFIFYTDHFECLIYDILTKEYDGVKYLSIHNPIKDVLRFRK